MLFSKVTTLLMFTVVNQRGYTPYKFKVSFTYSFNLKLLLSDFFIDYYQ